MHPGRRGDGVGLFPPAGWGLASDLASPKVGAELRDSISPVGRLRSGGNGWPPRLPPPPPGPALFAHSPHPASLLVSSSSESPFSRFHSFFFLSRCSFLAGDFDVFSRQETNLAIILASDLGRNRAQRSVRKTCPTTLVLPRGGSSLGQFEKTSVPTRGFRMLLSRYAVGQKLILQRLLGMPCENS